MKVLILGINGMLGYGMETYFKSKEHKVLGTDRGLFNPLTDGFEKIEWYLDSCDIVINCIGLIKPTIKNYTPEEVMKINTLFPKNLAKVCSNKDKHCYHITTDCVYSGKYGNYTECSMYDPEDLYGLSKLGGETEECMTIRTSIIGEERKGNQRSLLSWAINQKGKEVKGFTNHLWNGVTTTYLAEIIEKIENKYIYECAIGIHHIYSPDILSKYRMLEIFNEVYALNLKINAIKADINCDRSLSSTEDLSRNLATKEFKQQVHEMKELFKNETNNG